jgi:predicted ester cyclase
VIALALSTILFATPSDTPSAVSELAKLLAAGDPVKAAAIFTPDAAVTLIVDVAPGPTGKRISDEVFIGPDPVRDFLDAYVPGFSGDPKEVAVDGEKASWRWNITSDRFKQLGIDRVDATAIAIVRDGKIRSLTITPDAGSSRRLIEEIPNGNKARVREYLDRINARDYSALDDIVARSFDQHTYMPMAAGAQGLKDFYKDFSKAFPDFKFTLDGIIAEGDIVSVRMTARYTHKGEFMGIAPTNRPVTVVKFDWFRFSGNKCVAHWDSADRLGLLQQLGVVPQIPRWTATPGYEGFR